ncbi:MAG: hypothetical protein B7Z81_07485 [Acidocella sp. 20-61-6]|nr:MAG: hypothetical protein B7Z81_07485 [Acidocella sp. 20-61-6]
MRASNAANLTHDMRMLVRADDSDLGVVCDEYLLQCRVKMNVIPAIGFPEGNSRRLTIEGSGSACSLECADAQ